MTLALLKPPLDSPACLITDCPMPGTLRRSLKSEGWVCRFHFFPGKANNLAITEKLNDNIRLIKKIETLVPVPSFKMAKDGKLAAVHLQNSINELNRRMRR